MILSVSFAHFILTSSAYLTITIPIVLTPYQQRFRLLGALISETAALFALWYVLSEQERTSCRIGWKPEWRDISRGLGVLLIVIFATVLAQLGFQLAYHLLSGNYLHRRAFPSLLGFGISPLSVLLVILNPFFEELIVRAFTMTEIMELGGGQILAVLLSVAIQMSYHLYQGLLAAVGLLAAFVVFSIYFAKTQRIAPIIFAHFCMDAFALLRRSW